MAERIRAVKAKYPRPPINQQQWIEQMPVAAVVTPEVTTAPAPVGYPTLTPKMTVEEWLTQEAKMTREQWLEKQKNQAQPRQMTREEWLAEQLNLGN